jgi:uncharacterized surface protein with fasciclin (FAS1) repeats
MNKASKSPKSPKSPKKAAKGGVSMNMAVNFPEKGVAMNMAVKFPNKGTMAVKFPNKGNMTPKFPNKAPKSPKGPGGAKMGMMGNKGNKKGMNPKAAKAPKKMKAKMNKKNKKAKHSEKGGLVSGAPTPAPTRAPTHNPTRAPTRPPTPAPTSAGLQTVTGFVRSNPSTQSLFTLLERANFADALDNPALNLTLFAPNNNAFATFSATEPLLSELLFSNNEFIPHLQNFLLYHLSGGKRVASSFPNATVSTQFNNEPVRFFQEPFRINGIPIVSPNNDASNGIVHIIGGSVLLPSWTFFTIINRVVVDPELSILLEFLILAQLGMDLNVAGDALTLLAPTNTAFENLGEARLEFLRAEENRGELSLLLLYHVVFPVFTTPELSDGQSLMTIETGFVHVSGGPFPALFSFNAANAVQGGSDILCTNGVIQKIDAVLNPADGR